VQLRLRNGFHFLSALAAITLMVAMSDPKEKDLMIALIVSMLSDDSP